MDDIFFYMIDLTKYLNRRSRAHTQKNEHSYPVLRRSIVQVSEWNLLISLKDCQMKMCRQKLHTYIDFRRSKMCHIISNT